MTTTFRTTKRLLVLNSKLTNHVGHRREGLTLLSAILNPYKHESDR
jgi:hypothetical protein